MFVVVNLGEELKSPPLPLLEEIEICRTHTSTPTYDHTANHRGVIPSKQGYYTSGAGRSLVELTFENT